jgi:hypothetical protein
LRATWRCRRAIRASRSASWSTIFRAAARWVALNQAAQAFAKMAEPEFGQASGKAAGEQPANALGVDLIALLNRIPPRESPAGGVRDNAAPAAEGRRP